MVFKICIVGLGLMGASLAQALKGFKDALIVGVELDGKVREKALQEDMVRRAYQSIAEGAEGADVVIFCVYAKEIPRLLRECLPVLKEGCVVADICGVKGPLYKEILPSLPSHVHYVGVHPMAGKEREGIDNACDNLYQGRSLLICPTLRSSRGSVELMRGMARHIGCARAETIAWEKHDEIIAYTSGLMHISAVGLCMRYPEEMTLSFTAGTFRDCTRVADINADAWTELLMENRENTVAALDSYIEDLEWLRAALENQDEEELHRLLQQGGDNKREMMKR